VHTFICTCLCLCLCLCLFCLDVSASVCMRACVIYEQAQKVLEALESGGNVTEVDALFPPPISPRHVEDQEMVQAHKNLQREISSQVAYTLNPKIPKPPSFPLMSP